MKSVFHMVGWNCPLFEEDSQHNQVNNTCEQRDTSNYEQKKQYYDCNSNITPQNNNNCEWLREKTIVLHVLHAISKNSVSRQWTMIWLVEREQYPCCMCRKQLVKITVSRHKTMKWLVVREKYPCCTCRTQLLKVIVSCFKTIYDWWREKSQRAAHASRNYWKWVSCHKTIIIMIEWEREIIGLHVPTHAIISTFLYSVMQNRDVKRSKLRF